MYHDEIIDDVWKNRDEYVAKHQHNLKAIVEDLQERQHKQAATIINRRPTLNNISISELK